MSTYAFVAPIVPGKLEEWRKFAKELSGSRREEYVQNRKKAGIHREQGFLQRTPQGDFLVVVLDCDDPAKAVKEMASESEFNDWFVAEVQRIHGVNLAEVAKHPPNEAAFDGRA